MTAHHILTADIGGTNCRFALFSHNTVLTLERTTGLRTEALHNLGDVLAACGQSFPELAPEEADVIVLAVAGPISGLQARTTNASLLLDLHGAEQRYGLRRIHIVNDFEAQAYACLTFPGDTARQVLTPTTVAPCIPYPRKAVLGAGTGLGTASLVRDRSGAWLALPAEGGHTVFPFVGTEEAAFEAFIRKELGVPFARGDDVLTGRGLRLLHHFLEGRQLLPEEVGATALQSDSPTLRWFSRFYGRACRNWALTTLCLDGLYIAGGIAAKNPLLVTAPEFVQEFYTSPMYGEVLRSISVRLITDAHSGLWGAARLGLDILTATAIPRA